MRDVIQLPGPGSGLGYQWSPSPLPAHPWSSKRRTRDGRNGRTGTKFCRSLITQIVLSLRPTYKGTVQQIDQAKSGLIW